MAITYAEGRAIRVGFGAVSEIGQGLATLFQDVSVWVNRAVEARDPSTGAALFGTPGQAVIRHAAE
jgi:hypothetical protein